MFWIRKRKKQEKDMIREALSEPLDMKRVFSTINDRDELSDTFKSICRIAHPDRFIDSPDKMALAEQLFKEAQQYRTDLQKLKEIYNTATQQLKGDTI